MFSLKLHDSARAFETIVFFARPKDSFIFISEPEQEVGWCSYLKIKGNRLCFPKDSEANFQLEKVHTAANSLSKSKILIPCGQTGFGTQQFSDYRALATEQTERSLEQCPTDKHPFLCSKAYKYSELK